MYTCTAPPGSARPAGRINGDIITGAIGQAHVYPDAPGLVARCPACGEVVLRLVRGPDRAWLDLRGITRLQLAIPSS